MLNVWEELIAMVQAGHSSDNDEMGPDALPDNVTPIERGVEESAAAPAAAIGADPFAAG